MALPKKQWKQCEKCGVCGETKEEICSCGGKMKPRASRVRKMIGAIFLIVMVGGGVYYYVGHRDNDGSHPTSTKPTSKQESTTGLAVPGSNGRKIPPPPATSSGNSTTASDQVVPTYQEIMNALAELRKDIQALKNEVKELKPDASKNQELVELGKRFDSLEKSVKAIPGEVATDVGKQLKIAKQDIVNAVHIQIQEEIKQLQTHISEPNLAQFKQMFAELNVKLDKRDQNVAEVKQAIDELQSKLDTQFIATLAEIRELINSSPVKEDLETLKQAVVIVITPTVQLKQIADTLALKAENHVMKQMLKAFAQQLTILPFAVEEKQYPRLEFKINYFYQRKGQGIPQELTDKTVLLKGDELSVIFNPAQRSYIYILQKDVQGKCYLLYPDSDNFNPVQPRATGYEIRNFGITDETPGTETILFRATQQRHPQLERSVGHNKARPLKPEDCRPPVTLPTTSPILKVGSGGGQLLCEDCASVLTFFYH